MLCPNGEVRYYIGEITEAYQYHANTTILPHRRPVRWLEQKIDRSDLSNGLQNSTGSIGTTGAFDRFNDI